jgi:predicted nucleic acid-binding protein
VAPHLAQVEATNILRRLELAGRLEKLDAASALDDLRSLRIELLPLAPFMDRVWELRANLTSYDAIYVAIAEALESPLATLDIRLARATGPRCRFLLPAGAESRE